MSKAAFNFVAEIFLSARCVLWGDSKRTRSSHGHHVYALQRHKGVSASYLKNVSKGKTLLKVFFFVEMSELM